MFRVKLIYGLINGVSMNTLNLLLFFKFLSLGKRWRFSYQCITLRMEKEIDDLRFAVKITRLIWKRYKPCFSRSDSLRTWLHFKRLSTWVNLFSVSYSSRALDKLHLGGERKGVPSWSNAKHQTRRVGAQSPDNAKRNKAVRPGLRAEIPHC